LYRIQATYRLKHEGQPQNIDVDVGVQRAAPVFIQPNEFVSAWWTLLLQIPPFLRSGGQPTGVPF
jgi:hypothetical protein